jgi:MOSC domain-containing protein YiiM
MHEESIRIQARVIAVCTGPGGLPKAPREGPVPVGLEGLDGDAHRDRRVHGGPDQAVCAYLERDYEAFRAEGWSIPGPGAFGENLTLADLSGPDVRIGDRFTTGNLVLEVTKPRLPCRNLLVYGATIQERIRETGRTGFYCRVLSFGPVQAGAVLTRTVAGRLAMPEVLRLWFEDRHAEDPIRRQAAIDRLLAEPALDGRWRTVLEKGE